MDARGSLLTFEQSAWRMMEVGERREEPPMRHAFSFSDMTATQTLQSEARRVASGRAAGALPHAASWTELQQAATAAPTDGAESAAKRQSLSVPLAEAPAEAAAAAAAASAHASYAGNSNSSFGAGNSSFAADSDEDALMAELLMVDGESLLVDGRGSSADTTPTLSSPALAHQLMPPPPPDHRPLPPSLRPTTTPVAPMVHAVPSPPSCRAPLSDLPHVPTVPTQHDAISIAAVTAEAISMAVELTDG
jgi:hypothetical protein